MIKYVAPAKGGQWYELHGPVDTEHVPGIGARPYGCIATVDAAHVIMVRAGQEFTPREEPEIALDPRIEGLREYQKAGVRRIVSDLRACGGHILADDMGLGKTVQTIGSWNALGRPGPLLVVAPASVRTTWVKELAKWAVITPKLVKTGAQAAKVTGSDSVVVTSYALVGKLANAFVPQMVVLDEAHLLRGRNAERSHALLGTCKTARFRLALTGTPMWSRPRDFWMLLKILFGYRFGNADQFDYAYCGAHINVWGGKVNTGSTRSEELKLRLSYVMQRRTKQQVKLELPQFTRIVKWVPATKEAKMAHSAAVLGQLSRLDALNATLNAKIDTTVEAAVEAGKSLIFTWQKVHAYELANELAERGLKVEVVTGDYSQIQRDDAIERAWKTGATVVATIDAAGTGVDGFQQVGSTVIFHALDYVPIKLAQAEARLWRMGQTDPVTAVYICMEDSADSYILETVVSKLDQWRDVMGVDHTAKMAESMSGAPVNQASVLAEMYASFEGL